jgi:3-oxoadipate enol-lactonase
VVDEGIASTRAGGVHWVREGSGRPLVLLHSNGNSWHEYDFVREPLAADHDVILWDMPGQGDSHPLPGHLSIDDYADVVMDLIGDLGVSDAVVMGASVGGCIAAALGARYGNRLGGIGIVESQYRTAQWWAEGWEGIERLFSTPLQTPEQVQARFHSAERSLVERVNIDRHKAGGRTMMSAMWAIREFDIIGAVPAISCPALLLFGTAGPTFATAADMHRALPQATFATIDAAGHFPMVDHPDEFVAEVTRFTRALA